MRWWLCVVAALGAACDSSSSKPLKVVAVTTEGLAAGSAASAAYCLYTNGVLDKDAPAEVGGRSICPPNPADFKAARMAPKGTRLRVVFDRPLSQSSLARRSGASLDGETPATLTCGSTAVTSTYDYQPDDPLGPSLVIVPDFGAAGVPTSAACTLAIDNGVTDASGTKIQLGSQFEVKVADLNLVSIKLYNDNDTVLAPTGAVQFVFNADLDASSLQPSDFQLTKTSADVATDLDVPGSDDTVILFGDQVLVPGSYTASVRSTAQISETHGGAFVYDPTGTNSFAFTVTDAVVTSIEVTTPDPSVPLGVPVQFTATAHLSDGSTTDVTSMSTWQSANTTVATVSNAMGSRGLVTSHDEGASDISATYTTFSDDFALTIEAAALTSIDVSPATVTIADGRTQQFTALGNFTDGGSFDITNQVTWSTSDNQIATINSSGLATTVGNTTIGPVTITARQGTITDTSVLTVNSAVIESITVTCDDIDFPLGLSVDCDAAGTFSDGTSGDVSSMVTWTATPSARVTVSSAGLVTTPPGATVGTARVTATIGLVTDFEDIDVTDAVLTGIVIDQADGWNIPVGTALQFTATASLSDGSTCDLGVDCDPSLVPTWSLVDPIPPGTSIDQATGRVTSGQTTPPDPLTIRVGIGAINDISTGAISPPVLTVIDVTPDNISLPVGATQQYTAMGTFSNGQQFDITSTAQWNTSNTNFATIDTAGKLTAVAAGPVTVTATQGGISDTVSFTTLASAPEAGIEIGSSPILDGGDDSVGSKIVGQAFTRTYTITNAGNANLTVGAITFPSSTNCTSSVSSPPGMSTVGPSGSTTFVISVTPTATGSFSCKFAVANNDSNENPYDVDIRGIGVLDTGNFADMDGIYDGDTGCGFGNFTLQSDLKLVLANLAGNGPLTFLLTAAAVASANGVVVFSIGNHICTITRVGSSFVISMSCSNASGGSCSESFSRRAAPEINVTDLDVNNIEVFNGFDGGYARLSSGQSNVFWHLRIKNTGSAPLTIGTIAVTNDLNCNGVVEVPPSMSTLAPGAFTDTTLKFTPAAAGAFDCSVSIPNNDSDENPFVTGFTGDAE